jgi:hypothetical protein
MFKNFSKSKIGLFQAIGVAVYCFIIANVFRLLEELHVNPPELVVISFMLFLLVFSVAIVGSLIFGTSISLLIQKKTKAALNLLAFTLLYGFAIIIIVLFFVSLS